MIGLEAMNQIKNKADFLWKQRCNEEKTVKWEPVRRFCFWILVKSESCWSFVNMDNLNLHFQKMAGNSVIAIQGRKNPDSLWINSDMAER